MIITVEYTEDTKPWAATTTTFPVQVLNDAELLPAALGLNHQIGLVAGTGSVAVSRSPKTGMLVAGGWGWVIGDEGSAAGLIREAGRAVLADARLHLLVVPSALLHHALVVDRHDLDELAEHLGPAIENALGHGRAREPGLARRRRWHWQSSSQQPHTRRESAVQTSPYG